MFGKKKNKNSISSYNNQNYGDTYSNASAYGDNAASKTTKHAPFAVVEAYKSIRTNLVFLLENKGDGNVIALTSCNAGEGKSTSSVNLAIAFSQLEEKVLIIDGDMRRSSIHKKLKIENTQGLSNVLAGLVSFEEAKQAVNDKLDVLTSGQMPPNPSELLGSSKFEALLTDLRKQYRYIIVDTPPINIVSDALVIAPHTDGLLLVVRDGFTPHYSIRRAIANTEFSDVKILGAIMNGANSKSNKKYMYKNYYRNKYYKRGYGYGYGRGYGYGYGRGYGYGYGQSRSDKASKTKESDDKK